VSRKSASEREGPKEKVFGCCFFDSRLDRKRFLFFFFAKDLEVSMPGRDSPELAPARLHTGSAQCAVLRAWGTARSEEILASGLDSITKIISFLSFLLQQCRFVFLSPSSSS